MARKKLLTEGEIRQFMKLANLRPIGALRLSELGYPGQRDEMGEVVPPVDDIPGDPMAGGEEDVDMDMDMELDAEPAEGGGDMVSMEDFMSALERAIEEVTGEEVDVSEEPGDEEDVEADIELDMGDEEMDMGDEEEPMMEETDAQRMRRKREKKAASAAEEEKEAKKGSKRKGEQGFGKPYEKKKDLEEVHYGFGSGARREPKMGAPKRTGPGVGFGKPDPEEEEESEMLPGTPYDPEEEEELAKHRIRRSPRGRRPPSGVGIPGITAEQLVNTVAKRVATRLKAESRKAQMVDTLAERIMKRLAK